jgi:hypothetical protein
MVRFGSRPCGIVGAVITVAGVGLYTLGHGTGETGAILAAMFGEQYTVRLTCGGGRAFSQYTHGFNHDHAGGKVERNHPGCEAESVTPVRHHRRAGTYSSGIRL